MISRRELATVAYHSYQEPGTVAHEPSMVDNPRVLELWSSLEEWLAGEVGSRMFEKAGEAGS